MNDNSEIKLIAAIGLAVLAFLVVLGVVIWGGNFQRLQCYEINKFRTAAEAQMMCK